SEPGQRIEAGAARPRRERERAPGREHAVHADVFAEDGPRVAGRTVRCGVSWALPDSRVEELVRLPELPAEERGRRPAHAQGRLAGRSNRANTRKSRKCVMAAIAPWRTVKTWMACASSNPRSGIGR